MGKELIDALNDLEKEKKINKKALIEAIEGALLAACKSKFGKADNFVCKVDQVTGEFIINAEKEVVETVEDNITQISLEKAREISKKLEIGDKVTVDYNSAELGRIAIGIAKNVILQKIREEEKKGIMNDFVAKKNDIVTGIVSRPYGKGFIINLGRADAMLTEKEKLNGERIKINDRIKVMVSDVKDDKKGIKILVTRTHPDFVKRLFEEEVTEIKDGIVVIKNIAREPGSRTKMAVATKNPDVDPVGACVGVNGQRVNTIVDELNGEKIDIICWSREAAKLIENALSPAQVIMVGADEDERTALVVVPDHQLSLAIGKEGQNARLAAKLTGYKIDIKSESQAKELDLYNQYLDSFDQNADSEEQ